MAELSRRSVLTAGVTAGAAAALTGGRAAAVSAEPARALPIPAAERRAGVVLGWNRALLQIVRTAGAQPATVHPTRSFAIMHAALHDAVVSVDGGRPYLFRVVAARGASPLAAAAQAAHDTLAALYPGQAAALDARLAADLTLVTDPRRRAAGARAGALTARLLLGLRAHDGSDAIPPALPPGAPPGRYRPTPPALAPAVFTHWPAVTPFVLRSAGQFSPAPYPPLAAPAYARATDEVALLGRDTSPARTADQTTQARFWAAPIWNYWNEIAQSTLAARGSDLITAARVFAVLNLTFADAVIAFYRAKYDQLIWRPVTAVRLADTDGNPATTADPAWTPLANTPADPSYPGAHSVIARAGAVLLASLFGPAAELSVTSEALPGVTRTFRRFAAAAEEAGLSRIHAGVHTRLDHDAGQLLGEQVARFALARWTDPTG